MADNKVIYVDNNRIEIHFPFSWVLVERMRDIPDAGFDKPNKLWYVPATPFHADVIIRELDDEFYIGQDVYELAQGEKKTPEFPMDKRLYKFQQAGLKFIVQSDGRCILADSMGLGKTPQALAYANLVKGKTLVVAPANVIWKWKAEADKWTSLTSAVVSTSKEKLPDVNIHIMSYAIMRLRKDELSKLPYVLAIWDECHRLSNYKTQQVQAAKKIIRSGILHSLYLSGTPFLNNPGELFSVLNMIDPMSFPTFTKFAQRYLGAYFVDGHWYFPKGVVENRDELVKRLSSLMIRRTKQEVMPELPDKSRVIVPVSINMKQYKKEEKELRAWYSNGRSGSVLARMTGLRMVVGKEKVKASAELAIDILEQDQQVVLFAHHKDVVEMLRNELSEYKVGIISGDTKPKSRQEIVDEFLDGNLSVVIMTVAGAEGIDLYSASHIIFVEREWVPAKEEQAEDRLHRNGQKNAVTAYYITAKDTIDERLAGVVQQKRDVFGKVVTQDDIETSILEYLEA